MKAQPLPSRCALARDVRVATAPAHALRPVPALHPALASGFVQRLLCRGARHSPALDAPAMALRPPPAVWLHQALSRPLYVAVHLGQPRPPVARGEAVTAAALRPVVLLAGAVAPRPEGRPAAIERVLQRAALSIAPRHLAASAAAAAPTVLPAAVAAPDARWAAAPVARRHPGPAAAQRAPELVVLRHPAPAPAAPAAAAEVLSTPHAPHHALHGPWTDASWPASAAPRAEALDVLALTDRVVEAIDRRLLAARERMGLQ
jgi:hypothetical protein